ncbi:MAG: GAF domain-containing protein [Thermoleophilia bacterium]|nr:GAF domain-containing protein [Thermoleophilia bacterium]
MSVSPPSSLTKQRSLQAVKEIFAYHSVRLFSVAVLLLPAFLIGLSYPKTELIYLVYLGPIAAAAILLRPLEVTVVVLFSLILELITGAPPSEKPHDAFWSAATIAVAGLLIASASYFVRRYINPLQTAGIALEISPVAYAEFDYPKCSLVRNNQAFEKMTNGCTDGKTVFDFFLEPTAQKMAGLLELSASSGRPAEDIDLSVRCRDGRSTCWSVDFIPIFSAGGGTPQSVAMLAFEQTDSVQRTRVRDAAIRFSSELMLSLDLEHILRVAVDNMALMTEVNAGGICLIEGEHWVGKVGYGEFNDEMVQSMRFGYKDFRLGLIAAENRKTIVAEDTQNDIRCNPDIIKQLRIKSALIVPLVAGRRTIGVVWLTQTDRLRRFTEDQINFSTVMGSQAAVAISNARGYQNELSRARQNLEWIESLSQVTAAYASSKDIRIICQQALEAIREPVDCITATVFYRDREINSLVNLASIGYMLQDIEELKCIPMERTSLVVVQAVKNRAMIIQEGNLDEDISEEQAFIWKALGVEKERRLFLPLITSQELMGALCFSFPDERPLSSIDLDIVRTIASQLALAIRNWEMSKQMV